MYLPRTLIGHLYTHLLHTTHPLSPPVLLLVSLEPDALCACRILTALLKRDYIPHKIQPIAGYNDLAKAGQDLVRPMRISDGGSGGVVVCLGVGGLVDLENLLGLEGQDGTDFGGVEIWVMDARRPWNLSNVFGGRGDTASEENDLPTKVPGVERGRILRSYKPGKGGIVVFDDGDIEEELEREREAYTALEQMPELDGVDFDDDESDTEENTGEEAPPISGQMSRKRKSWGDDDEESEGDDEEERPAQRRRSNSSTPIPSSPSRPPRRGLLVTANSSDFSRSDSISRSVSPPAEKQPSAKTLRRRLLKLREQHNRVLDKYYSLGTSYSEPVSSIVYSLASELGREDNDLLWQAIVGLPPTPQSLDSSGSQGFLPDAPKFDDEAAQDAISSRFWTAYDSLTSPSLITQHIPIAQHLHRAILRTGTALIAKHQIRHLRAFRMAVVKEGPDAPLFTHAGALVKLALWVAEAVQEMEGKKGRGGGNELVMAGLDEARGVYVVVGLGGGGTTVQSKEKEKRRAERQKKKEEKREARRKEKAAERQKAFERRLANGEEVDDDDEDIETEEEDSSESESEDEEDEMDEGKRRSAGRNRFGLAFQEVIEETGARVKVDSFEHCVVEVRKEDLSGFLEQLSMKAIVG
ncbi:CDC45 family [Lasiodiplodia theobromae]|nr:CDC45 family [Lasiodiplodia theobromae]